MPRILTAVESYATLGEISDVLRRVFGEQRDARML
jgi:methylmalonyl-CoA mutase N-terminal domain/subunit